MDFQNINYDKKDGVAKITLNRPNVMNALTPTLLKEMKAAIEDAGEDKNIGVVAITGAGRAFSAGVDLKVLGEYKLEKGEVGGILDIPARELIEKIQSVPKVVIAMVNGYCYTGALEIVLSCDMVVASEEAKFGDTHTRWGLRPTWGMSQRLPRTVGLLKAKELSFTAKTIDGREAYQIGLANVVAPADELEKTMADLAAEIMANSLESIAAYKYLYNRGIRLTLEKGLELEFSSEFALTDSEDRLASFKKKG